MASLADKPVIVIKKKGGHHGHHGGAWKIAYADFVTAMMAFFLCMWLVNTADAATKAAIARYFRKVGVFELGSGTPLQMGGAGILPDAFAPRDLEENVEEGTVSKPEKSMFIDAPGSENPDAKITGEALEGLKEKREGGNPYRDKAFKTFQKDASISDQEFSRRLISKFVSLGIKRELGNVSIFKEGDFLTLELSELPEGGIFYAGSSQIRFEALPLLQTLAEALKEIKNPIQIIGHTDSSNLSYGGYTNWDLSTDRANAVRRFFQDGGLNKERILLVGGVADTQPKEGLDPADVRNRRVSIRIKLFESDKIALKDYINLEQQPEAEQPVSKVQTESLETSTDPKTGPQESNVPILPLEKEWRLFDPFD